MKNRIKKVYYEPENGWFVHLAPGWTIDGYALWREDTKRALMARIRDAVFSN